MKRRVLVWDIPTRLFHGLLAVAIFGAFIIALGVDDESATFPLHMLLGAVAAFLVGLRLLWGLVGTRYARFSSFAFGPRAVIEYFRGVITGSGKRFLGHNPGSAGAIFLMLALTPAVAITGALMGSGGEVLEELHEVLAYTLLSVIVLHVAGVMLHTLRHRENLPLSMVDGLKAGDPAEGIRGARPVVALLLLGLTTAWTVALVRGYDPNSRSLRLPVVGATLALGEGAEGEEHGDRDDDHGGRDDD